MMDNKELIQNVLRCCCFAKSITSFNCLKLDVIIEYKMLCWINQFINFYTFSLNLFLNLFKNETHMELLYLLRAPFLHEIWYELNYFQFQVHCTQKCDENAVLPIQKNLMIFSMDCIHIFNTVHLIILFAFKEAPHLRS